MKPNVLPAYRQIAVQGASPVGLVVMLYDSALTSLYRAMRAIDAGDVEARTEHLNRALDVVGQLQGSLDLGRGGATARCLSDFYAVARAKMLEAGIANSKEILTELAVHFASVRDAWREVDARAILQ